jgi:hypothetical protein
VGSCAYSFLDHFADLGKDSLSLAAEGSSYGCNMPSTKKPRVFIGSASEGREPAENLSARLSREFETVVWNAGLFELSKAYVESLEKALADVEFAILVATPDDDREKRGVKDKVPRDNVIFELARDCEAPLQPLRDVNYVRKLTALMVATGRPSKANLTTHWDRPIQSTWDR